MFPRTNIIVRSDLLKQTGDVKVVYKYRFIISVFDHNYAHIYWTIKGLIFRSAWVNFDILSILLVEHFTLRSHMQQCAECYVARVQLLESPQGKIRWHSVIDYHGTCLLYGIWYITVTKVKRVMVMSIC